MSNHERVLYTLGLAAFTKQAMEGGECPPGEPSEKPKPPFFAKKDEKPEDKKEEKKEE